MGRKKLTFENAMESLEEIVRQMESGDMPLNELIDKYNEGMKLSSFCLAELDRAEQTINTEINAKVMPGTAGTGEDTTLAALGVIAIDCAKASK